MAMLSIKSKLLVMLLGVSLGSIALVATLNYVESYQTVQTSVFAQLTSLRASRADAIEQYLKAVTDEVEVLADSPNMGIMLAQLSASFQALAESELEPEALSELEAFYREQFLPALDAKVEGTPELMSVFPETDAAQYVQYHYLARNPYPQDNRLQLDDPGDGSDYSRLHDQWHPVIRRIVNGFGYYDLFMIDIVSGDIVYTTAKEVDFGTNLIDGPHAQSNLARLFLRVQRNPDRGAAHIIDFEHYRPSFGDPAMFVAAPVFASGRPVGVVAVQESTVAFDRVVTGNRQWERDGLGKTGETVLVGPDYLLRSASRFLIEDPQGYAADQRAIGTPEATVERVIKLGSPILEQEARTVATEQALRGQTGAGVIVDYRGREILGSWAPLRLRDLDWAIVGKVDLDEAYEPIHRLARNTLIQTLIILVVITMLVMVLANSFVRPVNDLIARVRRFGAGDESVEFDGDSSDEIGDLARSFRELVESARKQTRMIEQVSRENEELLANMLPQRFAQNVQRGSEDARETIPEVSVIFAELRGLAEITRSQSADVCVSILSEFLTAADSAAHQHRVERIKTMGDTYLAAVGLSSALLDHMPRAVEFARELQKSVANIAQAYELKLDLIVGISAGPVVTNVSHDRELMFQIWGEAVIEADFARDEAERGQIVVNDAIRDALANRYRFEQLPGERSIALWILTED